MFKTYIQQNAKDGCLRSASMLVDNLTRTLYMQLLSWKLLSYVGTALDDVIPPWASRSSLSSPHLLNSLQPCLVHNTTHLQLASFSVQLHSLWANFKHSLKLLHLFVYKWQAGPVVVDVGLRPVKDVPRPTRAVCGLPHIIASVYVNNLYKD